MLVVAFSKCNETYATLQSNVLVKELQFAIAFASHNVSVPTKLLDIH